MLPEVFAPYSHLVVNLAHRPIPTYDVYIGRNFAGRTDEGFGNPIRLRIDTPEMRSLVLLRYWTYLQSSAPSARVLRSRIRTELAGKTLACWCAPQLCHGHLLSALANGDSEPIRDYFATLSFSQEG